MYERQLHQVPYSFINGKYNPADILSKHWAYVDTWPNLKPMLFWEGETTNIETTEDS